MIIIMILIILLIINLITRNYLCSPMSVYFNAYRDNAYNRGGEEILKVTLMMIILIMILTMIMIMIMILTMIMIMMMVISMFDNDSDGEDNRDNAYTNGELSGCCRCNKV